MCAAIAVYHSLTVYDIYVTNGCDYAYVADQVWISRDYDPRVLKSLVTCGAHYPENESNEA